VDIKVRDVRLKSPTSG